MKSLLLILNFTLFSLLSPLALASTQDEVSVQDQLEQALQHIYSQNPIVKTMPRQDQLLLIMHQKRLGESVRLLAKKELLVFFENLDLTESSDEDRQGLYKNALTQCSLLVPLLVEVREKLLQLYEELYGEEAKAALEASVNKDLIISITPEGAAIQSGSKAYVFPIERVGMTPHIHLSMYKLKVIEGTHALGIQMRSDFQVIYKFTPENVDALIAEAEEQAKAAAAE